MSQLKQFLIGKTKCLYNQCQSIRHHDQSRLVQQLPITTNIGANSYNMHQCKPKIYSNSTPFFFNESRFQIRQLESQKCCQTAIRSTTPRQEQQQQQKAHQENIHQFLCDDIPILEKLQQRQSSTMNTLQGKERKGKKRSYQDKHCSYIELKPPALKRQRMVLNNRNKCDNLKI